MTVDVGDVENSAISWKKLLARDMLEDDFSEKWYTRRLD
jgi:hypothetical protein